jgi:hypothetical protein
MDDDSENAVLARLPGGVWLASALIPDELPPRHVYRVIGPDGAVRIEYSTLIELIDGLDDREVDDGQATGDAGA